MHTHVMFSEMLNIAINYHWLNYHNILLMLHHISLTYQNNRFKFQVQVALGTRVDYRTVQ